MVAFVDEPDRLGLAVGVLPRGYVEVVGLASARAAPGVDGLDDVHEAIADGRLVSYPARRDKIAPATHDLARHVLAGETAGETDEVTA